MFRKGYVVFVVIFCDDDYFVIAAMPSEACPAQLYNFGCVFFTLPPHTPYYAAVFRYAIILIGGGA